MCLEFVLPSPECEQSLADFLADTAAELNVVRMRATSLGVLLSAQLLLEYASACSYRLRRLSGREKRPWKSPSLEELQSSLHTVFRVRMFGSAID